MQYFDSSQVTCIYIALYTYSLIYSNKQEDISVNVVKLINYDIN